MYSLKTKYELVGERLAGDEGTLLDIGSRDRILRPHLPPRWNYVAADVRPGLDLTWDLERPLPAPDGAYDAVAALDVLEHVENIHGAFAELLRIARRWVFITFPNITSLVLRVQFALKGNVGEKYALFSSHQGDRHRWLTAFPRYCAFVREGAEKRGWRWERLDLVRGFTRLQAVASRLPLPPGLKTHTSLFELTRR